MPGVSVAQTRSGQADAGSGTPDSIAEHCFTR